MKPNEPPHYKSRRTGRLSIAGTSRLSRSNLYSVEVMVHDVSTGGFMAQCPETVGIGTYVSLEVPGIGPVKAQVRWQLGARMGGMFLDPISLARCEWTAVKAEPMEEAVEA